MRLIFAGSSDFALPALDKLLQDYPPLLVISQPDKPAGRRLHPQPCPVALYAATKGLPLYQPEDVNAPESLARIQDLQPDLIVTASYGSMLRQALRAIPRLGAINLHPSLLPLYRGATPIQSALLNGDRLTGTTVFCLNGRMDAGRIICQKHLGILPEENFSSLQARLAELSAELLLDLLPILEEDWLVPRKQYHSIATYTTKLDKKALCLNWDQPANNVHNRIRAFSWEPGAFTFCRQSRLQILAAALTESPAQGPPGSLGEPHKNLGFTVNCRDQQLLIQTVQPSGKKRMSAWAFYLGARLSPSDTFTATASSPPAATPSLSTTPSREQI